MVSRYKQQISLLFQRFPLLGIVGQRIYRLFQARYTAGAVAVVFNDAGQILLLKHVYRPHNLWGLPGGWMNRNEDPEQTIKRELQEETGLSIQVVSPIFIELGLWHNHLDIVYLCRLNGTSQVILSGEILDYKWHDPEHMPKLITCQEKAVIQAVSLWEKLS